MGGTGVVSLSLPTPITKIPRGGRGSPRTGRGRRGGAAAGSAAGEGGDDGGLPRCGPAARGSKRRPVPKERTRAAATPEQGATIPPQRSNADVRVENGGGAAEAEADRVCGVEQTVWCARQTRKRAARARGQNKRAARRRGKTGAGGWWLRKENRQRTKKAGIGQKSPQNGTALQKLLAMQSASGRAAAAQ